MKLMPSIDARKWRQDAAKGLTVCPKSNKSIRTYRTRLVQLGLIDAHDHGQFWVIRFRFSLATLQSFLDLKSGGKVSPHTYPPEGVPPTEEPPSAMKEPAVEPSQAASARGAEPREDPVAAVRRWPSDKEKKANAIAAAAEIDRIRKECQQRDEMRKREEAERRWKRIGLMAAPT